MDYTPESDFEKKRADQRRADAEELASGKVTPDDLQKRNSWVDQEFAVKATFDRKAIAYGGKQRPASES